MEKTETTESDFVLKNYKQTSEQRFLDFLRDKHTYKLFLNTKNWKKVFRFRF